MNSVYMGLSYVALVKGLPAGIMALQPVLVTLFGFFVVERENHINWCGRYVSRNFWVGDGD